MATIQELLRQNQWKEMEDLLNKFKQGNQSSSIDDSAVDVLKELAPRSNNVIPFEEGGKISSYTPKELPSNIPEKIAKDVPYKPTYPTIKSKSNAPFNIDEMLTKEYPVPESSPSFKSDRPIVSEMPESMDVLDDGLKNNPRITQSSPVQKTVNFQQVPKDVYKLQNELPIVDAEHAKNSFAAKKNPIELVKKLPSTIPAPEQPPISEPIRAGLPKVIPQVQGQGIKAPVAPEEVTNASFKNILPNTPFMQRMAPYGPMAIEMGIPLAIEYGPDVVNAIKNIGKREISTPLLTVGATSSFCSG